MALTTLLFGVSLVQAVPSSTETLKAGSKGSLNASTAKKEKSCAEEGALQKGQAFIQDLGDRGIAELTGKNLSEKERRANFEKLFKEAFDYERIGKFVLGRHRKAMAARMDEYLKLFKDTIVRTYAARFGEYNHEKFKVLSSRSTGKPKTGQITLVVVSEILRPNGTKVSIEWQVYRKPDGSFMIYDVVVEGVSMALTQRSEYGSIIQNQGGVAGLLERMRKDPPKAVIPTRP